MTYDETPLETELYDKLSAAHLENDLLTCERDGLQEHVDALLAANADLLELAEMIAGDFLDAADWKDARGKLVKLARAAIDKAVQL